MKNNILKFGLLSFFTLAFLLPIHAGPGGPGNGGGGFDEPGDEYGDVTPIDNWLMLLVFAGIVLGAYLIKQRKILKNYQ